MRRREHRVKFGTGCQAVENPDTRDCERPGAQPQDDPGLDPFLCDADGQAGVEGVSGPCSVDGLGGEGKVGPRSGGTDPRCAFPTAGDYELEARPPVLERSRLDLSTPEHLHYFVLVRGQDIP